MRHLLIAVLLVGGCDVVFSLDRPETGWAELEPGLSHVCGRARDGALFCWGGNNTGQVGTGDELAVIDRPMAIEGSWTRISAALGHTCGIRSDRSLWCWGANGSGMLGTDSEMTRIPKRVDGAWTDVATGYFTTCALDEASHLWCWGFGDNGQIGDGALVSRSTPVQIGDAAWIQIASAGVHTCGLRDDGTLWCWGDGTRVILGDFDLERIVPEPVQIGVATWRSITALFDGMCGITTRGELRCWGSNAWKQMGIGADTPVAFTPTPVTIEGADLRDWDAVDGGYFTACGLRGEGDVWCWGDNQRDQLGTGQLSFDRPVRIVHPTGGRWTSVRAGTANVCLTDDESRGWCTGANGQAQLADGGSSPRTPRLVDDAPTLQIDAGRRVTCAIRDTTLACAGAGGNGLLGTGSPFAEQRLSAVSGLWKAVASGAEHQCAIAMDGRAHCWGSDYLTALGNGVGRQDTVTPVPIAVTRNFVAIDAGTSHTCAIGAGGAITCWGYGLNGQIGDNNLSHGEVPRVIAGGADWAHVSAGGGHTCGIDVFGSVRCWGQNASGEVGDNTTTDRASPVALVAAGLPPAPLPDGFVSIAAGSQHSCAVGADGSMWCWGANERGQLAVSTGFASFTDAAVKLAETGWVRVSAGAAHTCAIRDDGTLWCWGANDRGQLGDGSLTDRRTPTQVAGEPWESVSCGLDHTCGLRGGKAYCWGNNDDGTTATGDAWTSTLTEIKKPAR